MGLHLITPHLYLNLHPALAPAQHWPIRRPVQVQEEEKDNEQENDTAQEKEERPLDLLKQATSAR